MPESYLYRPADRHDAAIAAFSRSSGKRESGVWCRAPAGERL